PSCHSRGPGCPRSATEARSGQETRGSNLAWLAPFFRRDTGRACPGREGSVRGLTLASFGWAPQYPERGKRTSRPGGSAPATVARRGRSAMSDAAVRHGRPPKHCHMRRTPCRGGVRLARSRPRRVHHLQLAELLDPPLAVLAAEPAPLDAAEGDLGAHAHVLVDPGRAALEALGDLLAARDV